MDAAPSSDFRPNLDLLDEVIHSLTIDTSGVAWTSTTGSPSIVTSDGTVMPGTGEATGHGQAALQTGLLWLAVFGLTVVLAGFVLRRRASSRHG